MIKKIAFVTLNKFPNGDAGSHRLYYFAKIFKILGYDIKIISYCKTTNFNEKKYDNLSYVSLRGNQKNLFSKLIDRMKYKKRAIKILQKYQPDVVWFTDIPFGLLNYLKKSEIETLIYDAVEWYSASEFRLGYLDPNYIIKNILITKKIDERIKVIAISKYLKNYFSAKGISTIRIPFLYNYMNFTFDNIKNNTGVKKIIYCGSPGNKDNIKNIISSLLLFDEETKKHIKFEIIGMSEDNAIIKKIISKYQIYQLQDVLKFHGRLSYDEVANKYKEADYSIFIRPKNERYSMAGFPTKFVESLAYGVPVITNITSDLAFYLKDMINGIVVEDLSVESIKVAILKAISIDDYKYRKMRINCLKTIKDAFYFKNYINILLDFINKGEDYE